MKKFVFALLLAAGFVIALSACNALPGMTDIGTGESFTCALNTDGTVSCWGYNNEGQLGDGSLYDSEGPVRVAGISNATAIAVGSEHACARLDDGTARCWGDAGNGQMGDGLTGFYRLTPVTVSGLSNVTSISASGSHTCARLDDGTARCWGRNNEGQLGDGTLIDRAIPVTVSGLTDVSAISVGAYHTCATLTDGTVECWGRNSSGQLGDGTTASRPTSAPVAGITTATAVDTSDSHTCARLADGTARCWGINSFGQLGDGTVALSVPTPVTVAGLTNVASIAAGGDHTCARLADGTARCWGLNGDGQVGDPERWDYRTTPVEVPGLANVTSISAGGGHTCARVTATTASCWGNNVYGQVGDHSGVSPKTSPGPVVKPQTLANVADTDAGLSFTCALIQPAATVSCWGANGSGQLGDGTTDTGYAPKPVPGLVGAAGVAAGNYHACAVLTTGTVSCWGVNTSGQLGDGTTTNRTTPVTVSGITTATAVFAGANHTCARLADGTASCWGDNGYAQLGDGTTTNRTTPVTVAALGGTVSSLTAGTSHTCALLGDGSARCWGWNGRGQLGDGTTTSRSAPVAVAGLAGLTHLAAGENHTCARVGGGPAYCWGSNSSGEVGDGTTTDRPTPVLLSGLTTASIFTGSTHTCANLTDDSLVCWGENSGGQLGNGTTTDSPTPVTAWELTGASDITGGSGHTCARLADATAWCWGQNNSWQLGDGTATHRSYPVRVVVDR